MISCYREPDITAATAYLRAEVALPWRNYIRYFVLVVVVYANCKIREIWQLASMIV
jgi:hypothetical protein